MFDYEKFIDEFNGKYFQNFADKADLVVEAFVKYYGEKHRAHITDVIYNASILSFMPASTEEVCTDLIGMSMYEEAVQNTYSILSILGLPNIAFITNGEIGGVVEEDGEIEVLDCEVSGVYDKNHELMDGLLTRLFGSTNLFTFDYEKSALYNFFSYDEDRQKSFVQQIFKTNAITPDILERINSAISFMDDVRKRTHGYEKYINAELLYKYSMLNPDNSILRRIIGTNTPGIPAEFEDLTDNPEEVTYPEGHYIALPIFITDENDFIHEMNHAVTSAILATIDDDFLIEKSGIVCINDAEVKHKEKKTPYSVLQELLNERMTQDIANIIHESGIYIFDESATYNIHSRRPYRTMLPLIEPFYQKYKELLKEASISNNQSLIYTQIDKKGLEDFEQFIDRAFLKTVHKGKEPTQEQLDKAAYYTEKLQRPPYKEMDVEEYLKALEKSGYKVTRLNSDDDPPKQFVKAMPKKEEN